MTIDSTELLQRVVEIQTAIVGELRVARVIQLVSEHAQELTEACGAVVEMAEGDEMVYKAASGLAAPHVGLRLKSSSSLSGRSVACGEILTCDDTEADDRVDREACRKIGLRSMVVVPLRGDAGPVGVLKVMSDEPRHFTDQHVYILQLMAGFIASVMHSASAFEHNQMRAHHDALTGLANRALFDDRIRYHFARLDRAGTGICVIYVDIDGFKAVNDTMGHRAGDAVLMEVSRRLGEAVRKADTVARLGGDEFAVLAPDVKRREDARSAAARIRGLIEGTPFELAEGPLEVRASVGFAFTNDPDVGPEGLLEQADRAMYEDQRGRGHREQPPHYPA
jgi:diguanylate cyclase (GGDEF)-like protein